jgi:GntR family transcriptional regulator
MSPSARGEYRKVADDIRDGIENGKYPRGELLPVEERLAEDLGVHRATVNKALKVLLAEGLVRVHRGKGTYVNAIPKIKRDAVGRQRQDVREAGAARGAFDAELRQHGLTAGVEVTVAEVAVPDDAAERLAVDEGATVLARQRVMTADGVPVQTATSYIPLDIAAGTALADVDPGPGGSYSRLAELGHAVAEFTEDVDVRPPSQDEIRALRMSDDQRVYEIVREARTAAGRVVEVNVIVLPVHQWCLRYRWPAG